MRKLWEIHILLFTAHDYLAKKENAESNLHENPYCWTYRCSTLDI